MAHSLVTKEAHTCKERELLDKINTLEGQLKAARYEVKVSRDTAQTVPKMLTEETASIDGELAEENQDLKNKLDECMRENKKLDEDYTKLMNNLTEVQDNADYWADMSQRYVEINATQAEKIKELQTRIPGEQSLSSRRDKLNESADLQGKLEQSEFKVKQTEVGLHEAIQKLKSAQDELELSIKQENRLKDQLGLHHGATEKQVRERVRVLKENDETKRQELNSVYQDLRKVQQHNVRLKGDVSILCREKERVEFELRQLNSRFQRLQSQRNPVTREFARQHEERRKGNPSSRGDVKPSLIDLRFPPPPEHPNVRTGLSLPPLNSVKKHHNMDYCFLCRRDVDTGTTSACKNHYRSLRDGRWACCGDDRHTQAGCLSLKHVFLYRDASNVIFLTTDNKNFIKMQ